MPRSRRFQIATDAGMLESAKWRLLIVQQATDRYPTGLDLRGNAARALNVCSAHVSVEAVLRIVGNPDCILFVLVGDDRKNGPENLFPSDSHLVRHVDENRGLYEIARFKAIRMPFASDKHLCAFFNALAKCMTAHAHTVSRSPWVRRRFLDRPDRRQERPEWCRRALV
jgi:hypothetical protein